MSGVDREHLRWAYRLFLDREAENDVVLERPFPDTSVLRQAFIASDEFREKNRDLIFDFPCWVIKETLFGFRLWVSLKEMAISRAVLMDIYEPEEARFIAANIKPGDHVLDIGANIGFFAMLMGIAVAPGGSVRAFEPLGYLYEALCRSTSENRFEAWVQTYRLALADSEGTALFRHAPRTTNFGGGHLVTGGDVPDHHVDEAVETRTLDSFLDDRRVSFIKIDVEGAEPRALRGGDRLLQRDRPTILSELHNPQLRAVSGISAGDFIAEMRSRRYECYSIENGGVGNRLAEYGKDRPMNVVFLPDF